MDALSNEVSQKEFQCTLQVILCNEGGIGCVRCSIEEREADTLLEVHKMFDLDNSADFKSHFKQLLP